MKTFDFDKFSKSAWLGSRRNYAWNKYPDVITAAETAKDILAEHKFNAPPVGDEQCLCGWSGDSWGDHIREVLTPAEETPEVEPEAPKRPRKKAEKASEDVPVEVEATEDAE